MTDLQKRSLLKIAALTAVASATLVGCGKKEEPAPAPAPAPAASAPAPKPEPLKIAFAYIGPVGDGVVAHGAHLGFQQLQQVASGEVDLAGEDVTRRRQQAQQRQRGDRLAATGLAEQDQRLTGSHVKVDAVDGSEHPA